MSGMINQRSDAIIHLTLEEINFVDGGVNWIGVARGVGLAAGGVTLIAAGVGIAGGSGGIAAVGGGVVAGFGAAGVYFGVLSAYAALNE